MNPSYLVDTTRRQAARQRQPERDQSDAGPVQGPLDEAKWSDALSVVFTVGAPGLQGAARPATMLLALGRRRAQRDLFAKTYRRDA